MKECGILFPSDRTESRYFKGESSCIKPDGHYDAHLTKLPDGKYIEWEYDLSCTCSDCLNGDDFSDTCILYSEVELPKTTTTEK